VEDHVHLLCALSRTCEAAQWSRKLNALPRCGSKPESPI
jgi:hypothetical protein